MSAALQIDARAPAALLPLVTIDPRPGDLRYRAHYWREQMAAAHTDPATRAAVEWHCDAMLAMADRMERPEPIARLVPAKAKTVRARPIGAEEFWTLHAAAVRAIVAARGARWAITDPGDTAELTLPARLCSYTGPLGGRIRWRRDQRVPVAKFWPGGRLPDGVTLNPIPVRYDGPMGDDHPSLVMIRAAVAEQIMRNRIARGRPAIVAHWQAQHRMALHARAGRRGMALPRAELAGNQAIAGNCRRAMAAELAELARH